MSKPFEITALKRQINTAADIIRDLTNQLDEERQKVVRLNAQIESLEKHNRNIEESLIAATDEIAALKAQQVDVDVPKGSLGEIKDWEIDHSTCVPILVYKKCSVIESEQAYGVLELFKKSGYYSQKPVVLPQPYYGDRNCLDKREVITAIEASGGTVADDGYFFL